MRNKCRIFCRTPERLQVMSYRYCSWAEYWSYEKLYIATGYFFGTNLKSLGSPVTNYEAVNGGAKCRIWGSLGRLRGTQGHGQCHYSIERIRLPIQL